LSRTDNIHIRISGERKLIYIDGDVSNRADKIEYLFMSLDKNAGRSHNIKFDSNSFERVEQFKYLGTNLTNQNSI